MATDREEGQSMVEAAVVFPLVVLAVLTMIYIMIFMYAKVAASCGTQMATRKAAGSAAGTVAIHSPVPAGATITYGHRGWRRTAVGEKTVRTPAKGFVSNMNKAMEANSYVLDEKREIRITDFVGENLEDLD